LGTPAAWAAWSLVPSRIDAQGEPAVAAMPAMLRRRAGFLGKMALEVAYQCLDGRSDVPAVFCSRHGEVGRALGLLDDLAGHQPLSPSAFGLAVHNASAGLFSIARSDRANHLALAAGSVTVEHAVVEACALLADGAPMVLLVAYDTALAAPLSGFADCDEQSWAWAWLMTAPTHDVISLGLSAACQGDTLQMDGLGAPGGLDVLRFQLSGAATLVRSSAMQRWTWSRDA
jgi:hypothetical protein